MIICYHNIFVGIFKHQSSAAGLCGLPESGEVFETPGVSVIHPRKDVLVVAAELKVLQLRLGRQLGAWGSIAYEEEGCGNQPRHDQHLHIAAPSSPM